MSERDTGPYDDLTRRRIERLRGTPVTVMLTYEEAQTLVAMRNACQPGSEAWDLAASGRSKIADALDAVDGPKEKTDA